MKEKIEKIINRLINLFKNNKKPYFPKDYEDVIVRGDISKAIDSPERPYCAFGHNTEEIRDENGQLIEVQEFTGKGYYISHKYKEGIKVKKEIIRCEDESFKDSIKVNESEMNKTAYKEINAGEGIKEMEK